MYGLYVFKNNFFKPNTRTAQKRTPHPHPAPRTPHPTPRPTRYALRLPMVAAVGTYLWLHESVPSGQVWASPPHESEAEPDANNTVPMYVTNGSYAPLSWAQPGGAAARLNSPESDARPPALHLLANTMPRLDRVLVRSAWHAKELGEQLALHGQVDDTLKS